MRAGKLPACQLGCRRTWGGCVSPFGTPANLANPLAHGTHFVTRAAALGVWRASARGLAEAAFVYTHKWFNATPPLQSVLRLEEATAIIICFGHMATESCLRAASMPGTKEAPAKNSGSVAVKELTLPHYCPSQRQCGIRSLSLSLSSDSKLQVCLHTDVHISARARLDTT